MTRPEAPGSGASGAVLGLDVGTVRVGLAASDPTRTIASPVATLARADAAALWEAVSAEARRRGARRLVVGLPRRLDGSEGTSAAEARALAAEAARVTGLPVELCDERFTTAQAERSLIAAGVRRRRRRGVVDAVAAALLLQGWLDGQRALPTPGRRGRAGAHERAAPG